MYLSKHEFKEEIAPVVEAFINGFVDVLYKQFTEKATANQESKLKLQERIMTAKEVCKYYNFHNSTLRRHEEDGLRRIPSRKNKNRMFRFTECERYFNQKK